MTILGDSDDIVPVIGCVGLLLTLLSKVSRKTTWVVNAEISVTAERWRFRIAPEPLVLLKAGTPIMIMEVV